MGIETGEIGESQIKVSSIFNGDKDNFGPSKLSFKSESAWSPDVSDKTPYIQVKMNRLHFSILLKNKLLYYISRKKIYFNILLQKIFVIISLKVMIDQILFLNHFCIIENVSL